MSWSQPPPARSRARFNSAPLFFDSDFEAARASAASAEGGGGASNGGVSRSRAGSNIPPGGFFCPMCKEQLFSKQELLAHCCGESKQSLASVRMALGRQRSVRLTADALERWAKHGTPAASSPTDGDALAEPGTAAAGGGGAVSSAGEAGRGGAAMSPQRQRQMRRQRFGAGARRMTVSGDDLRIRGVSASPTAAYGFGGARQLETELESAETRKNHAPQLTGFICPHCKLSLPGKRELLLHRCDDGNSKVGTSGGGAGQRGAGGGGAEEDCNMTPQQRKREERRKRFEFWQQQCHDLQEGAIGLDTFMVNCGPKVGVKPQWACESRDGRSHIRVGPGNNTKSGRRLRVNEVLLELKHVKVEGRHWVAFYDDKSARVMWTPTMSLSGKIRLRRYDPVAGKVVDEAEWSGSAPTDAELPVESAAAMQRAVYHARMEKHAREGRLKPGISTDVSGSMEFIRRLHECVSVGQLTPGVAGVLRVMP